MYGSSESSDSEIENLILLYSLSKRRTKSVWKSEYMKKRETHGEFVLTSEFDQKDFKNYTRLTRDQFNEIHLLVKDDIFKEGCNFQKAISTEEKLTLFLRYIATGDSYKSLAYSYRMNDRTVSNIVRDVSHVIWQRMQPIYMPEPSQEQWKSIAADFKTTWNFPHCIGSIDGKHVTIMKPGGSGSSFFNYKGRFSIVLLASVDAKYKFTTIDVGSMGRFSDSNIFWNCPLGKRIRENTLSIPPPEPLMTADEELPSSATSRSMPFVFVGDEAFPLLPNLMRPYPKRKIENTFKVKVFNYRLSRARQTVECAFGLLASRFRVFRKPFEIKLESVDNVVKAACILHNYLRANNTTVDTQKGTDIEEMPTIQLLPLQVSRTRPSSHAFDIRDHFKEYFSTQGSVSWQETVINQGKY